jgi:hypothetical protein
MEVTNNEIEIDGNMNYDDIISSNIIEQNHVIHK